MMTKPAKLNAAKQKLLNNQYRILHSSEVVFESALANLHLAKNAMTDLLDNVIGEGAYTRYVFQDGKVVVEVPDLDQETGE